MKSSSAEIPELASRHNGDMPARFLPAIDPARCTACGRCVAVCAPHVLSLHPVGWVKTAALDDAPGCTGCAQCRAVCPFGAVRMVRASHPAPATINSKNRL